MTTSHGRRIQSRRALAILAWVSLVTVAGLLWYGQEKDIIRIQAWEPAALLLSAYSAFLAIFGWLLFAPERKSAEESPALFFSGMLTLIPPCFIAYHLMPPSSPLRGWLTLAVFVFGLIAILSPLPAEVFAVPRDRKSYLQPLTDCYLSVLDVEEPQLDLQSLVPRSYHTLTTPDVPRSTTIAYGSDERDPWTNPFYGTGRSMSEVGSARRSTYSESRTRGSDVRADLAPLREPVARDSGRDSERSDIDYRETGNRGSAHRDPARRESARDEFRNRSFPQAPQPQPARGLGYPAGNISPPPVPTPVPPVIPSPASPPTNTGSSAGLSRPPMTARSAFAPRESRAPNYQPQSPPLPNTTQPGSIDPLQTTISTTAPRRPLTEPSGKTTQPVGFQTPSPMRPVTSSPPPVPSYLAPAIPQTSNPASERVSRPSLSDSKSGLEPIAAVPPLASAATYDQVLKSAVSEFRSITEPAPQTASPQQDTRPFLDSAVRSSVTPPKIERSLRAPETDLRELDRRIKELEAADEQAEDFADDTIAESAMTASTRTSPLNDVKMERLKDEHGGEMIDGTIRVFFEVGQKRAHLHVPFSPPLAGLPEVECEAVSDDSVRCKVAVRQPYGIRIEARRSEASRALTTDIGFAAVYTPSVRRG